MFNKEIFRYCLLLLLSVCGLFAFGHNDTVLARKQFKEVVVKKRQSGSPLKSATPRQNVSADETAQFGAANVSEAIKHMAGVTVRDYGGAGGMKTVSIRGLGAQFTAVNYDGVAVSDIQNGQIDLQRYTLSGIGNISLQIGDGTDIFSSARNATLPSLIEINTSVPTDQETHLFAQTTLGAWGYTAPSLKFDKSFGKLSLSLVADYVYAENDYPFTIYNISERIHKRRLHSLMNQGHGEATLGYRFNDSHYLSLKTYYYDNDRQLPGIVRYYTSESEQNLRERNAFSQLQYRGRLSRKVSLKSAAKWNWASSDYKDLLYTNRVMDARYFQREGYLTNALL
ncbi:MAG: TonB-dependent receptor, partial [Bacteroidaceae bacterium]